jgi:hypothetical protein
LLSQHAVADEGGVSFWLPGTYGSLASVPAVPGWSFSTFNYYDSVERLEGRGFCSRRRRCGRSQQSHRFSVR